MDTQIEIKWKTSRILLCLVNILLKRASTNPATPTDAGHCALWNYDMHAQNTDGVPRAYLDTISFAPAADTDDGAAQCTMTKTGAEGSTATKVCDCSTATGKMPEPSSGMFFETFDSLK